MKFFIFLGIFLFSATTSYALKPIEAGLVTDFVHVDVYKKDLFNAHSSDIFVFYQEIESHKQLIPFEINNKIVPFFETISGAECQIQNIWIDNRASDPQIIIAKRDMSESYYEKNNVTFSIFSLFYNKEKIPGFPEYYFHKIRSFKSREKYCDVNAALQEMK